MEASSSLLCPGAENAGAGERGECKCAAEGSQRSYNTFLEQDTSSTRSSPGLTGPTIQKLNAPHRLSLNFFLQRQRQRHSLLPSFSNSFNDDCEEAAKAEHFSIGLWVRYTIMAALLLAALSFVSIANGFPSQNIQERQLGAPPLNDFQNVSRPAQMAEYDAETWTLGTHVFLPNQHQVQPYIANGYHGSRLTAEGAGYWVRHLDELQEVNC
jgi:hypothetical protein